VRTNRFITTAAKTDATHGKAKSMRKIDLFFVAVFMAASVAATPSAQAAKVKVLHVFEGKKPGDGVTPFGAVIGDAAGNIYGTTLDGGNGNGTVFKIDSTGKETILLAFDPQVSGSSPDSSLIQDQAGNLYGVAEEGPGGAGVIYKLSPQGQQTLLHAFQLNPKRSPAVPAGGLLLDKSGNIFGATFAGGQGNCPTGCGTIYRLDTAGKLHILYEFTGGADGSRPFGQLVEDAQGNLYGIAKSGGEQTCPDRLSADPSCGTVFKLDKHRQLTVLHSFTGVTDGAVPQPGLLLDAAGDLYGTTSRGGDSKRGVAFKISKSGAFTVLHRFAAHDGAGPNGGLVMDRTGNLYGSTSRGSAHSLGTVFQLSPDGQLTVLHVFKGGLDGAVPNAGLFRDANGHLFGTTSMNLLDRRVRGGSVFELIP